ncbi:MAG: GntR family transcriptional regulator [Paracoccaceae bacterium]
MAPLIDRNLATPPQVYDLLRDRIQSSDLPPGTAINERALAEWLGISRTPIREAIRRLASEGLINVIPKVGTRVAPVDPARVIECCIIRNSLEMIGIAKAAAAFTKADGRRLDELIIEQERTISTGDTMRSMALDIEFHRHIMLLSGYSIVEELLQKVMGEVLRARHLSIKIPGRPYETIAEHRAILAALQTSDPVESAAKMQSHLNQSYLSVLKVLAV